MDGSQTAWGGLENKSQRTGPAENFSDEALNEERWRSFSVLPSCTRVADADAERIERFEGMEDGVVGVAFGWDMVLPFVAGWCVREEEISTECEEGMLLAWPDGYF